MFKILLCAVLTAATLTAQAQQPPTAVAGTLVSFSDASVTLKDKGGNTVTIAMTPGWTVSVARPTDNGAIKAGAFVATTNVDVDANSGRSTELRILEPGYEPEHGTHSMSQNSGGTSMTHGTVQAVSKGSAGVELNVVYPGGSRHVIVPDDIKVTAFDLRERSSLKPGLMVSTVTRTGADGVARAGRLVLANP